MRQENETLPLYRRCPSPQSRANHFKENPLFPLQKGQLGKKEGSDNWKQLPPRAAPACPKGGAAQASVPHSPQQSHLVTDAHKQGGKRLLLQPPSPQCSRSLLSSQPLAQVEPYGLWPLPSALHWTMELSYHFL